MSLFLVDDQGLVVNAILWLAIVLVFLLLCSTLLKLLKLCFTCHQLCNNTVYRPIYLVYTKYKDYMRIDPLPVFEV